MEAAPGPFPFRLRFGSRAGADPFRVLLAKGRRIEDWRENRVRTFEADPFEVLGDALAERRGHPGGAAGWLGYDLGAHLERLPRRARDDRGLPDLLLAFHDEPRRGPRAMSAATYLERFGPPAGGAEPGPARSNLTREEYLRAVAKVRDYIAAGDVYQVNLSQRFHVPAGRRPREVFDRIDAPHAGMFEAGALAVVGASPELFLHVQGRRILTRPIKGTRPRAADPAEDRRLRDELLASPKDDAELAMIVDLERNDLGRVCLPGSIRVTRPKDIETFPTVHHLVASVEGTLEPDVSPVDVLRATFPGGSVTGAPKIRAMEIIDELEPTRRAAYTGTTGWIGFDGTMELSVAIRVAEFRGRDLWFQVGGGIVWDSDPAQEYDETLVKARALASALGISLPIA